MTAKITTRVKVSAEAKFLEKLSHSLYDQYTYVYIISIENYNEFPVRLLSRHWYIFDSIGGKSEVIGDGVVGANPIIYTNSAYQYTSGCNLKSDFGTMGGYYIFENFITRDQFNVEIPTFELSTSFKQN